MKHSVNELAIFDGPIEFPEVLHVGRPNIGDRENLMQRISDMLDRRWLTNNGPYVQEFESKLADYLGVKNCIVVCNGTIALEIAIRALNLKGEVIVPSFTFIASAHALQWQEITPVFCDIDPSTHNLNPEQVEKMITPRTTGILGVHVWGRPCAVVELSQVAKNRGLHLLYDAAHAFGCSSRGKMIGSFGDAEVFSFHATKFFNSFEGGAITTNNDELAEKIRWMTNFGFSGYDNVIYLGTNGKMSEISAAMGLTSFESLESFVEINRRNYHQYQRELGGIPGISLVEYDEEERNNFQYIILEIDQDVTGISRDEINQILHAEKCLSRRYFFPGCHQMEPYRSYFPHAGLLLKETEKLTRKTLSLPNGTAIGPEEVHQVCDLIQFCITHSKEIRNRLQ